MTSYNMTDVFPFITQLVLGTTSHVYRFTRNSLYYILTLHPTSSSLQSWGTVVGISIQLPVLVTSLATPYMVVSLY